MAAPETIQALVLIRNAVKNMEINNNGWINQVDLNAALDKAVDDARKGERS